LGITGSRYYKNPECCFGPEVATKFSAALEDIENAGDCLALEQGTASVFHLMRVLELAVQHFARRLRAPVNPSQDTWNKILDAINGKLRQMPRKTTRQQNLSARYATAAAHLNAVRIAWRNEVMHPKQTYTLDEASQVFDNVGTFIKDLARML
jgi:hypothetical protein